VRTLIGKEPQTNLLYMDKELNVCEQCIYYCNATAVPVCGDRPVFS
jgi:uracil-DNA glycosylase